MGVGREGDLGDKDAFLGQRMGDIEAVQSRRPLVFFDPGVQGLVDFGQPKVGESGREFRSQCGGGGIVVPKA